MKASSILLGIHDPFAPFENIFCALCMGGLADAITRAFGGANKTPNLSSDNKAAGVPSATTANTANAQPTQADPANKKKD